ncbi:MAG TPA: hypothetical protein PL196_04880, partial [Burkholderiaceae bacterium]|nr:hypothetical protein [Burkholderiaceae bacterium]
MKLSGSILASTVALAVAAGTASAQTPAETAIPTPGMIGSDAPKGGGYSNWDVQLLYGNGFREPGNPNPVAKTTLTVENASAWSWGSSYFFVDVLRSDASDQNAWEVYGEWYPSASIGKMTGRDLAAGMLSDVSLTLGLNAGRKSTGANPLVFLPGLTFDLKLPGFAFFSLGTYAYIDRGTINNGQNNGCHATAVQVTPSWLLPFAIGGVKFQFDGFLDYISSHGACVWQVVSQPRLTLDHGGLWSRPDRLYAGIEYQYWHSK